MWMSNAILTGQSLPHPVYECASEAVETAGPSGLFFCTKLSNLLALDNGQLFQSTVVSM